MCTNNGEVLYEHVNIAQMCSHRQITHDTNVLVARMVQAVRRQYVVCRNTTNLVITMHMDITPPRERVSTIKCDSGLHNNELKQQIVSDC